MFVSRANPGPRSVARFAAVAIALPNVGCGGGDPDEGTVRVVAYGEEFVEEGIAASDMNDGWAVSFDRFDVTIENVEVGEKELGESVTVDLSVPSGGAGHEVGAVTLPAGQYDGSSFEIERIVVEGSATRDDIEKTFSWVFDGSVKYTGCETTTTVVGGKPATFQITIHADHLFYDSLVSEDPPLLFSPLADADADGDGEITSRELETSDIGAYDPGNENIDDLYDFLIALSGTIGHVDGEGHCVAQPVDE